jgi:multiple sugar transport system substrate-binding protein
MCRLLILISLCVVCLVVESVAGPATVDTITFLSTQLAPGEEAQKMRSLILRGFSGKANFTIEEPQRLAERIENQTAATPAVDVIGALHGEFLPLIERNDLSFLDPVAAPAGSGLPDPLLLLGRFGTVHQFYLPWMQSSYVMIANKKALAYLPAEANVEALTYDQFADWGRAIEKATGHRLIGFPAGPQGLMHRFFEGFLYPSYTDGVVVPFRSRRAEEMWTQFASLWQTVNPASTTYDSMRQPLLAGDVWLGFDHIARVIDVLRQRPDDFIAFPAPAGPVGRGYMSVVAGLAVPKNAPDQDGARSLIDYLRQPEVQLATAVNLGFFPVVKVNPDKLDPGLKSAADALEKTRTAKDAVLAVPPAGLGARNGAFDKVFIDTFHRIVLRGEKTRAVLDDEAVILRALMTKSGARCWRPDPLSNAECPVH